MGQQQCQGNESEEKMSKVTFDFNGMKYAPAHPEHVITENLTACKYVDYDNAFCFCSTFGRTSGFIFVDAAKKLLGIVRHSVPVSHPDAVVDWGSTERINAPAVVSFDAPQTASTFDATMEAFKRHYNKAIAEGRTEHQAQIDAAVETVKEFAGHTADILRRG
jgi:hypothetical protein